MERMPVSNSPAKFCQYFRIIRILDQGGSGEICEPYYFIACISSCVPRIGQQLLQLLYFVKKILTADFVMVYF